MHAKRLVLVLTTVLVACAVAPGIASAAPWGLSKLRVGGSLGAEDYLYTAGNTVYATGKANAGSHYRFVVSDPSGAVRSTSDCAVVPSGGNVHRTYAVQPSDPASTVTAWQFQFQQYSNAGCTGSPARTSSLYFDVATAAAYADSALTTPKSFFTFSQTSYVSMLGVGKVKTSPTNTAASDWSVTWLLP